MNEQAQKVLADLLQKASNGIDSAVSFSQAQIPDVVHQLLMWNAISSIVVQLLCLFIIAVCFVMCVKTYHYDIDAFFLSLVFSIIASSISLFFLFSSFDWLKIWVAPKLYLIEYAASLMK